MEEKMRVLAVGAHPDDIEVLCAGTLARYAKEGHHVTMAYVMNGNMGHMVIPADELAEIRREEARRAAEVIGADFIWMGIDDELIVDDIPTRMKFVEMVRQARPDVVLTHYPEDYIMGHRRTSSLVFEGTFLASVPHAETESPVHDRVPPIFHMDTPTGMGFLPTEWVDITETMETKKEMLLQHQSQLKWLKDHDDIDVVETMTAAARYRGLQVGVGYAEGFRQVLQWPRGTVKRLLP